MTFKSLSHSIVTKSTRFTLDSVSKTLKWHFKTCLFNYKWLKNNKNILNVISRGLSLAVLRCDSCSRYMWGGLAAATNCWVISDGAAWADRLGVVANSSPTAPTAPLQSAGGAGRTGYWGVLCSGCCDRREETQERQTGPGPQETPFTPATTGSVPPPLIGRVGPHLASDWL